MVTVIYQCEINKKFARDARSVRRTSVRKNGSIRTCRTPKNLAECQGAWNNATASWSAASPLPLLARTNHLCRQFSRSRTRRCVET
jgi:hypothetical protein